MENEVTCAHVHGDQITTVASKRDTINLHDSRSSIGQGRTPSFNPNYGSGFFQLLIGEKEREREREREIIFVQESDSWKFEKNRGHARYAETRPINSNSAVKEGTRKADVDNCA